MKLSAVKLFATIFLLFFSIYLTSCIYSLKLIQEKEYIRYKIPKLDLDFFAGNRKNILVDYLTKSSEWHVFPMYGTIIAMKRNGSGTCNPIIQPLPSSYPNRIIPYLSDNYFNLYSDIAEIPDRQLSENKFNENTQVSLKLEKIYENNKSKNSYSLASDLIIESHNKKLNLHTYEFSKDVRRSITTKFLISTGEKLKKISSNPRELDGYNVTSFLPLGSVKISPNPMILIKKRENKGRGAYAISGYINPGKKGFIYLKIMNKKTGEFMLSDPEGTNAEYIGWSKNNDIKFNFCLGTEGLTATKKDGIEVLAEFQIWFKPSDNSPEKILSKQILLTEVLLK